MSGEIHLTWEHVKTLVSKSDLEAKLEGDTFIAATVTSPQINL